METYSYDLLRSYPGDFEDHNEVIESGRFKATDIDHARKHVIDIMKKKANKRGLWATIDQPRTQIPNKPYRQSIPIGDIVYKDGKYVYRTFRGDGRKRRPLNPTTGKIRRN